MTLKLKMFDSQIDGYRTFEIDLNKYDEYENPMILKMAIHDLVKQLELAQLGLQPEH